MIPILPTSGNHHSTLAFQFTFVFMYLPLCNVGVLGSIPGLGWSPGEGKGYSLQNSGLENFKDCIVHGVAKYQTRLSDFHFTLFTLHINCIYIFLFLTGLLWNIHIISTMFICVVACGRILFLLKAESSSIIYSCHMFSPIHPSLDLWVAPTFSYFYHATMKWVCKNILIRHFYWLFWGIYSELGLLDHILIIFFNFWGSFIIFPGKLH